LRFTAAKKDRERNIESPDFGLWTKVRCVYLLLGGGSDPARKEAEKALVEAAKKTNEVGYTV
jgi:hypothetical protein